MADPKSDETLMLEYQEGSYQSFEILYKRHKQSLFRFMLGLCHNQAIVEELFQEVWMKLIDAKDRYQVNAKFTTYLFQIARNRVIDHYRKSSTQSEHNINDMDELINQHSENHSQPEQLLQAEQTHHSIFKSLNALPYEQKEVFLLKENADLSINEIAELLSENPETVKSRLRYAVKKLQQGIQQHD